MISLQSNIAELSILCFALSGALVGYLVFNSNKAIVFMGDTGSLSLGGFIASLSIISGNLFYVAIIGIMYVVSGISVIIQVIYYKRTRRRVFLMAPLHHHFQMKGYSECKICTVYSIITLIIALSCLMVYV
jgi:phospho-N-acetylmuramoyl-pentapeptide-transferase